MWGPKIKPFQTVRGMMHADRMPDLFLLELDQHNLIEIFRNATTKDKFMGWLNGQVFNALSRTPIPHEPHIRYTTTTEEDEYLKERVSALEHVITEQSVMIIQLTNLPGKDELIKNIRKLNL